MFMCRVDAPKRAKRNPFASISAALCALSVAATPLVALAQTEVEQPAKPPEYEANVKALAEVIGALHSLRSTCDKADDQTWRLNMQSLLDREGRPGAPLRVGMINAFNDGYQEQQKRFPTCNAGAKAAQKTFGAKGGEISRRLAQRNY